MSIQTNIRIIRDENEDLLSQKKIDKWIFYILIVSISIIPLLIGGKAIEVISPLIDNTNLLQKGTKIDIFTFLKFRVMLVVTIMAFCLFLYKMIFLNYKISRNKVYLFISIFIVAITISTLLSPTKSIALTGQYNRHDGALSYICYTLLIFISMNIKYPQKFVQYVLYAFYPTIVINFIIITLHFLGKDVMQFNTVQDLLTLFLPEGTFLSEEGKLVGTLNHYNYMSGMFSILAIIFISWTILEENNKKRVLFFLTSSISFSIVLMALSKSGFLTILCFIPILVWFILKSQKRIVSLISFLIFISFGGVLIHILSNENPKVWDESIGIIIPNNPYISKNEAGELSKVTWDKLDLTGNKAYAADKQFELPVIPESGVGPGSGRLFIWERTIDLTMERPLFGYGLDTLMYNFPHNDIELRANLETETVVVDKPHNLFIGVLYGTGILGFIGFFGIITVICWFSLKEIITKKIKDDKLLVLLSVAWIAYIFQSLFNDSLPGVTAPFWIIGGIILSSLKNKEESLLKE